MAGWAWPWVLFIIWSGVGPACSDTVDPLLGRAPDPEFVEHIRERILSYPGVLGTHDLMVHDYGPGRQFASVHVEMPAEANVLESHDVIDNIEQDFLRQDGLVSDHPLRPHRHLRRGGGHPAGVDFRAGEGHRRATSPSTTCARCPVPRTPT